MHEVTIRSARYSDRFALARILIDATHDAFRGRVPDRCLGWLSVEESAFNWGRNFENGALLPDRFLIVADVSGMDVIGLAMVAWRPLRVANGSSLLRDCTSELVSLQVDPAWQRRGVGRKLVASSADWLAQGGWTCLRVGILAENPNRGFYEALGARLLGSRPYDWEGYKTKELVYVWDDTSAIRASE